MIRGTPAPWGGGKEQDGYAREEERCHGYVIGLSNFEIFIYSAGGK